MFQGVKSAWSRYMAIIFQPGGRDIFFRDISLSNCRNLAFFTNRDCHKERELSHFESGMVKNDVFDNLIGR